MSTENNSEEYKWGFETPIEREEFPKGLSEEIIHMISDKNEEPDWLREFRLKAFRHWQTPFDAFEHSRCCQGTASTFTGHKQLSALCLLLHHGQRT